MIDYLRSLQWIDYYFFAIIDPRRLASLIIKGEGSPVLMGCISVGVAAFINIITFSLTGQQTQFFYYKLTYGWILRFLLMMLFLLIYASMIDLFCQFRGRQGSIKNILNMINMSFFTHAFILPLFLIFKVIQFAPAFFLIFFIMIITIWQALIIIQGISEIHHVSFSEAMISFLFPALTAGVIFFFAAVLMIINLVNYLSVI